MSNKRILIVEDHDIFRLGVKMVLIETGYVVDEAKSEDEFLELIKANQYELIILDYFLPHVNGESMFFKLKQQHINSPILFLTSLDNPQIISRLLSYDVRGLILKSSSLSSIRKGILEVLSGKIYIDAEIFPLINASYLEPDEMANFAIHFGALTKREIEIIQAIADGLVNKEIGDKLNISKRTVDVHRRNILAKIPVKSFSALVLMAYRLNIIK
jgi:DNA-binding NarL/FixJ family response regulator